MPATQIILAILLGLGLSASTGLNTFLPLLLLSAAARFHIADVTLGAKFEWLTSDVAMIVLVVVCIIELVGDKVPAIDHLLDVVGTFLRPMAGSLAAASVLDGLDPTTASIIGVVVGAPTSFGFHTLKAGTRVASTTSTFGCANPVLSFVEDVLSFGLSVIAIFAPVIVPLALALLVLMLWWVIKRLRSRSVTPAAAARSAP